MDLVFGSILWESYAGLRGFILDPSFDFGFSLWVVAALSPGRGRGRGGGREAHSKIPAISAGRFRCLVPEQPCNVGSVGFATVGCHGFVSFSSIFFGHWHELLFPGFSFTFNRSFHGYALDVLHWRSLVRLAVAGLGCLFWSDFWLNLGSLIFSHWWLSGLRLDEWLLHDLIVFADDCLPIGQ